MKSLILWIAKLLLTCIVYSILKHISDTFFVGAIAGMLIIFADRMIDDATNEE